MGLSSVHMSGSKRNGKDDNRLCQSIDGRTRTRWATIGIESRWSRKDIRRKDQWGGDGSLGLLQPVAVAGDLATEICQLIL